MRNFKEDIKIDKFKLDKEWEDQANKFVEWAEAHAEAIKERDYAKDFLDLTRAELDEDVRKNYISYGLEKVTDKIVESWIIRQEKYKDASKCLINSNYHANVMKVAKDAFEHRKEALDNLTRLYHDGFWSCNIPKDVEEKRRETKNNEENEKIGRRVGESVRKRKEM